MTGSRVALYVAADDERAREGAAALAEAGESLSARPAVDVAAVRERAPAVDCVVFAETPTTPEGAHLLDVADAAGETPLVLFSEPAYGPTAARSTDGIDGYVRRGSGAAFSHLADEVGWHCHAGAPADPTIARLREMATEVVACRGKDRLFDAAIETAEDVLAFDACRLFLSEEGTLVRAAGSPAAAGRERWPIGIAAECYERGEAIRRDASDDPGSFRSALAVPIGDRGVFQAVADRPGAFEEGDLESSELLVSHVAEALARLEVERELVSERDRLSALFDDVPDPALRCELVDGAAIVRDVNPAFESTFGFDREAILGEDVDDYLVPPAFEEVAERLNERIEEGRPIRRTTRRRTAEGVRDFRVTLVPVDPGERGPEGFAIYTDVTERKRRERELAARDERLDEFASVVSDDLRSPLNVARGYLELAEETGDPDHFAEVERAHGRMERLVDRLLALSRRDDLVAATEPVALHDVARRAWADVDAGDASLEFERDAILEADERRLRELLGNLVRNAVEHGGDAVAVRIGATDDGFYVADDGVGVPADEHEAVFEAGYTAAEKGTGYGLAIVDRIAAAHDWTVAVGPSAGGGARFDVRGAGVEWIGARQEPRA